MGGSSSPDQRSIRSSIRRGVQRRTMERMKTGMYWMDGGLERDAKQQIAGR